MSNTSTASQVKADKQEATQAIPSVAIAGDPTPYSELKQTLAEEYENIQMLEKAIITVKQAEVAEVLRYKPLFVACSKGDESIVRALLATGLDVNWRNHQGVAPLHVAACDGQIGVVKILLEQGAEIDPHMGVIQASNGLSFTNATPFCLAIVNQKKATADLLLSYGADAKATMGNGMSWGEMKDAVAKVGGISMCPQ
jgi:hypothetical protein